MADDKFEDILAFDESLDIEKDVKSNEKLTVERGCVKVDVNCTKAEQDSTQDQEKLRQEYERGTHTTTNLLKTKSLFGKKSYQRLFLNLW